MKVWKNVGASNTYITLRFGKNASSAGLGIYFVRYGIGEWLRGIKRTR